VRDPTIHVIKVGGALLNEAGLMRFLAHAPRDGLVIVHGGGALVDQRLRQHGIGTSKAEGLRATCDAALPVVVGTLAGEVNTRLVADLVAQGVPAVGLTLADGPLVRLDPADPALGFVGTVRGGDAGAARALLDAGFVPVIASIGADDTGQLRNVNADDAAAGVASALGARRLTFIADTPGVLDADGRTIDAVRAEDAETMIKTGVAAGGMAAKLRAAARAARAHGIDVRIAGVGDDAGDGQSTSVLAPRRTQPQGTAPEATP